MIRNDENGPLNQLENIATNFVELLCAIVARAPEMMLRPWFGTRYYTVLVVFGSTLLMLFLPVASLFTSAASHLLPMGMPKEPEGLFSLGAFCKLYFILCFAHAPRLWYRMLHMERELHSEFEGPALPFFQLFPMGSRFWPCRIFLEPIVVLALALLLRRLFIITAGLSTYLEISAFALGMKSFIAWYRAWEYLRTIIDTRNAAPIIGKMTDNKATEEDLATIHLAGFPKNLSPDIRQSAIAHIARVFEVKNDDHTQTT
jgi:hypothetical protein